MVLYFVKAFLLWSLCAAQLSDVLQPVPFQTVKLGDSATIECHIKSELKKRVWYKFTIGKRLQLVVAFNNFYKQSESSDESHYSVKFDTTNSHLSISATTWEDVGTYFCGVLHFKDIQFGSGTFLMVKGANTSSDSVVQRLESKSVQPGDSVTLSCSVHTSHCAAEHTSVTWLKNSLHYAPQMIYASGDKICQRTESGGTTCVYSLLMRNLSSDDAGTYYCVVTSCGQTLFGNGTRINIHNNVVTKPAELSLAVIALTLSNILLGIVTLILIWTLCKSRRKDSTTEATDGSSEGNQTSDAVAYAAVCLPPRGFPPQQATGKYSGDSVVYSTISYCQKNREMSS
ncbi:signal-regulatory protein beta-2-like [Sebastes umbrosus]|uniref:signal-regulatory protein beta-2-like n=1 Tax=Sebastes umbrosus TaxID=72105 RepID=UPI00189E7923|nr:signal-regulatory protein beta-2-like [Sebastes umbrosus]